MSWPFLSYAFLSWLPETSMLSFCSACAHFLALVVDLTLVDSFESVRSPCWLLNFKSQRIIILSLFSWLLNWFFLRYQKSYKFSEKCQARTSTQKHWLPEQSNPWFRLGAVAHACSSSTLEAKAGGFLKLSLRPAWARTKSHIYKKLKKVYQAWWHVPVVHDPQ